MIEQSLKKYREAQFEKLDSKYYAFMPKIKIVKNDTETHFFNITEVELEKLKKLLTS